MGKMLPIHPGEILREEFLEPIGLDTRRLAEAIHVSPRRINAILKGQQRVTPNTDLKLSAFFGTSEGLWLRLQIQYDLEREREAIKKELESIRPYSATG